MELQTRVQRHRRSSGWQDRLMEENSSISLDKLDAIYDDGRAVESIDVTNVAAALTSLTQDLESVLQDLTSFGEKVTIPHGVLIPAITRHLASTETSDRAIKALSILLSLDIQTLAIQEQAAKAILYLTDGRVLADILKMEEANGHILDEGWINSAVILCDVPSVLRSA
eukprot:scaffold2192_cov268-Chaetoceros_neogracile.AAC.48